MHINLNNIIRKHLKLSTKAVDLKKYEICGYQFKSEKGMNDLFLPKCWETVFIPFIMTFSHGKFTEINTRDGYVLLNHTLTECLENISLASISIV